MSNYEATRYDFDGANLTGIQGVNTGIIVPWSSSSVPTGFLECNGANVSRSTYSDLFAVVGTTYGSGDGSSTFGLPDLQDNVAVGKSDNKALASTGGANTVANSGSVSTTVTGNVGGSTANATLSESQLASHDHQFYYVNAFFGGAYAPTRDGYQNVAFYNTNNAGSGGGHSHNMSANFSGSGSSNFTGSANSVLQPYVTTLYIIKT